MEGLTTLGVMLLLGPVAASGFESLVIEAYGVVHRAEPVALAQPVRVALPTPLSGPRLGDKALRDATKDDVIAALVRAGWQVRTHSSMNVGDTDIHFVHGSKDETRATVRLYLPTKSAGARSSRLSRREERLAKDGAVHRDGDVVLAVVIPGNQAAATALLARLLRS